MNLLKSDRQSLAPQLDTPPSAYSIYKRIAHLAMAVFLLVICINLWLLGSEHAENWYENQASQLGRSLSQQAAMVLAKPLMDQDNEGIAQLLANLQSDPHVSAAAVFNHRGQIVNSTRSSFSLLADFRLRQQTPLVFVEEIQYQEQVRGYLRLLLDHDAIMRHHGEYQRQIFEQMAVVVLLAIAFGWLLTRVFYKVRFKWQFHRSAQSAED